MKRYFFSLALSLFVALCSSPACAENLIISGVAFSGLPLRTDEELLRTISVVPGKTLYTGQEAEIAARLQERGIYRTVSVSVAVAEGSANVELRINLVPETVVSEITASGTTAFSQKRIRQAVGLRYGEPATDELLSKAVERLTKSYREEGFYNARVQAELKARSSGADVTVHFSVEEGNQASVEKLVFTGEIAEALRSLLEKRAESFVGYSASRSSLQNILAQLRQTLRLAGYLRGSIRFLRQDVLEDPARVAVVLLVNPRDPVEISFSGNRFFSQSELLAELPIVQRRVPFGTLALNRLCLAIEERYHAEGFLTASVSCRVDEERKASYRVTIDEGEQTGLAEVEFENATVLSTAELLESAEISPRGRGLLGLRKAGVTAKQLLNAEQQIQRAYRSKGYREARVTAAIIYSERAAIVRFSIHEGEPTVISNSSVELLTENQRAEELSQGLGLKTLLMPGAAFSETTLEAERQRLVFELTELGFPNATVSVAADETKGEVRFILQPGRRIRLGRIVVSGNRYIDDGQIVKALDLKTGDFWQTARIRTAAMALTRLGYFRSVTIEPLDGTLDGEQEDLVARVVERDTGSFKTSAGFNTEEGVHLTSELAQRNFLASGHSVIGALDGYFRSTERLLDSGRARLLYGVPNTFAEHLLNEAFVQHEVSTVEEFSFDRYGIGSTAIWNGELTVFRLGADFIGENLFDVEPSAILGESDSGTHQYGVVEGQFEYDLRDDVFNPRRGGYFALATYSALEELGSDASFVGGSAQQAYFYPLTPGVTLALNARYEIVEPIADAEVVPLSRRLFLGGRQSLRGFTRNKIGPRAFDNSIVGGDRAVQANFEIHAALSETVDAILFLDAGQVALENQGALMGDPHSLLGDLRYSPGLGLRYKTPIGPLFAEYGFALDREAGERAGRLNFGIGGMF